VFILIGFDLAKMDLHECLSISTSPDLQKQEFTETATRRPAAGCKGPAFSLQRAFFETGGVGNSLIDNLSIASEESMACLGNQHPASG